MLLATGALIVAMLSFQLGASVAKELFPSVGAAGATTLRQGFGAVMLALVMRPWRTRITRAALPALIGYGVALGLMNLMFYMALRTVPLGIAVTLEFAGPLGVAAFSIRRAVDALWIGLAIIGLLFLLPLRGPAHGIDPGGAALALGAGAGWACYIVFGQRAGHALGAHATAYGAIIAALLIAPVGIHEAGRALLSPAIVPAAAGLGLLSCAMPYALEMVALTRMPARAYGTLTSLEPAIGSLVGLMLLHEALTAVQWAAVGGIVLASIGTALTIGPPAMADATAADVGDPLA